MPLKLTCSNSACGEAIEIRDAAVDSNLNCPKCGQPLSCSADKSLNATMPRAAPRSEAADEKALAPGTVDEITRPTVEIDAMAAHCPTVAAIDALLEKEEDSQRSTVTFVAREPKGPRQGRSGPAIRIPGYEILAELGHGGMGVVYKARQTRLQRVVALKMIIGGGHARPASLERFRVEAEAIARLQHPHIVQIHEIGEHKGLPYFSLEYCPGGSLDKKLKESPLPPRQAAELVEKLAHGMAAAHQKGILHRDLKPANVLLAEDGTPKITDFGLAKKLDDNVGPTRGEADITDSNAILGTPSYMAPEQALGETRSAGPAADIYALGAILYDCLTGRPPFKGASALETLDQVRRQEPAPPRQLNERIPRDLETICLKCLRKEASKRYASATELADDLRRYLDGRPIQARPVGRLETSVKWVRRNPAMASLMAVSVMALLSLVLFLDQRARTLDHRARAAQRELSEQQRSAELRDNVQRLFFQAGNAFERGELQDAQGALQAAAEIIGAEPPLANLQPTLTELRRDLARRETEQKGKREANRIYEELFRLRDDALLASGMVFTGVELPANLAKTKETCREALAMLGVSEDRADAAVFPSFMPAERRRECAAVCFEMLLVWAEAEAQPEPGRSAPTPAQLVQANRLMDRAGGLEIAFTGAYHLRRAGYLELQGNGEGAERERQLAAAAKLDALDYFLMGDWHQKQGRLGQAAIEYGRALQLQPKHFWAHYFLAICQLRQQLPGQARENLTACLMIRNDLLWLYLLRGFASGQLNDFPAAEDDFQKALALKPNDQQRYGILVNQGSFRLRQAQLSGQLLPLSIALPLAPNVDMAYRGVAEAYRQERLAAAARALQDAIDLKSDQFAAYRYLAGVSQEQRKLDKARDQLGDAITNAGGQAPEVLAQLFGQRARLYLKRNETDQALADLDRALATYASAADHIERGKILHARRRYNEALSAYDAATRLQPKQALVYRLKADALMALEQFDKAAQALDAYLANFGQRTAEVFRLRAGARARLKQHAAALSDYTQALDLVADSPTYAGRGWVHLATDAQPLAWQDFANAIRLDPKNAEAHAGRALVNALLGRRREALDDVDEALRNGPKDARLLWNAAHVYAQLAADAESANARPARSRGSYQADGVKLLRQALAPMPAAERAAFWSKFIVDDRLLNPLRDSPAFDDLERDYGNLPKKRIFGSVN